MPVTFYRRGAYLTNVRILNTLSGGHPLGGLGFHSTTVFLAACLNTLSGGHPLGGSRLRIALRRLGIVSIPSQVGILLVVGVRLGGREPLGVSIPSQVGILLVGASEKKKYSVEDRSQYPLRWASSWWGAPLYIWFAPGKVSIPSQVGILLVDFCLAMDQAAGTTGLNTLSGGHPLGGDCHAVVYDADGILSQYPLRWASSWWQSAGFTIARTDKPSQYPLRWASSWWRARASRSSRWQMVSIPSQVGILLVVPAQQLPLHEHGQNPCFVSIPSQVGILLVVGRHGKPGTGDFRLNTLSGGHPLGGLRGPAARPGRCSLNTLSGGHPLGGMVTKGRGNSRGQVSIPSQVGILLVDAAAAAPAGKPTGLNTLSGGHPLGGNAPCLMRCPASRLNTLSGGHPLGGVRTQIEDLKKVLGSQYPLRWASSWWKVRLAVPETTEIVSIPSQVGILLVACIHLVHGRDLKVSIPSQVGILLVAPLASVDESSSFSSQYPLRWASSWWHVASPRGVQG